jgi:hypothetical protein
MKIAINVCRGGFALSKKCAEYMAARGHELAKSELEKSKSGGTWFGFFMDDYRTDPLLIEAIEVLGSAVNRDSISKIKLVEVPEGVDWFISDHFGKEMVVERHRTWN